jgi:hypothetical protein
MRYPRETIDPFLTAFVAHYRRGKTPESAKRIDYLHTLLRRCLEAEGEKIASCDECRALLAAERSFRPDDAFARLMDVELLVFALEYFIHPPWLRSDPAMATAQWRFVDAMLASLGENGFDQCECIQQSLGSITAHIDRALGRRRG